MEIIDPRKLLIKIALIFDKLHIDYFVTGGMAVSMWGKPRSTADIDVVIKLIEPQLQNLIVSLRKLSRAGYADEEIAKKTIAEGGEFNFIDPVSGVKVDFWILKKDRTTGLEFERKIAKKVGGQEVYFISPEDLILSKLRWFKSSQSERQIEDIRSILKIQRKLDLKYLKKMAKAQGILDLLANLLKKST